MIKSVFMQIIKGSLKSTTWIHKSNMAYAYCIILKGRISKNIIYLYSLPRCESYQKKKCVYVRVLLQSDMGRLPILYQKRASTSPHTPFHPNIGAILDYGDQAHYVVRPSLVYLVSLN